MAARLRIWDGTRWRVKATSTYKLQTGWGEARKGWGKRGWSDISTTPNVFRAAVKVRVGTSWVAKPFRVRTSATWAEVE